MAVDFRLSYNNGLEFIDLFPQTDIGAILNNNNLINRHITGMVTNIPVPSDSTPTQIIDISGLSLPTNNDYIYMFLISTTPQSQIDYATISQFEINNNQLIITRLYNQPQEEIQVRLIFIESGVNDA